MPLRRDPALTCKPLATRVNQLGCRFPASSFDLPVTEGAVKYMMLIYLDEAWARLTTAERQALYMEQRQLSDELEAAGKYHGGNPLHPPSTATCVRVRDGKRLLTDGPFAETREHLGGYMLVEAENLDEALAIAARGALARIGTIEVRPVREGPPS